MLAPVLSNISLMNSQTPPDSVTKVVAATAMDSCAPVDDQPKHLTLTIRLIKSFEYRTFKNLVLQHIDPEMLVKDLKILVLEKIKSTPGLKPYHNTVFDCLKLYVKAHGSKTQHLIINLDHDEGKDTFIMDDNLTLSAQSVENETELSFFNHELYTLYKAHPNNKW
ncbi:hypothetical protein QVD99_005777 [Batrachochytrium dendrobatidis]|nr:hypothetical protein QVD99_005777 [Batrachochytrium dendrobatidis]